MVKVVKVLRNGEVLYLTHSAHCLALGNDITKSQTTFAEIERFTVLNAMEFEDILENELSKIQGE